MARGGVSWNAALPADLSTSFWLKPDSAAVCRVAAIVDDDSKGTALVNGH